MGAAVLLYPRRRHRAQPAQTGDERRTQQPRDNRTLLAKLCVIVVAMFGFGYALVPFYEKICEATGLRNIARADEVENTQVDATRDVRIEFDSNVRKLPWPFRRADAGDRRASGRSAAGDVRDRQHDRPPADRPGDSELRPAAGGAVFPEARVLLLREADAAAGRAAADAGRVRRRRGAARRTSRRSRCRTRSSRSKVPTNLERQIASALGAAPVRQTRRIRDERSRHRRQAVLLRTAAVVLAARRLASRCCCWAWARRSG